MNTHDLRRKIDELSNVLIPLAANSVGGVTSAELLDVLEGAFRKNLKRMQAVGVLSAMPQQGSSALELARNMLEDAVSIEYMLAKGGDEMAARFHEFRFVQLYEDLQYYYSAGVPVGDEEFPDTEANIKKEYEQAIKQYPDFLDSRGKPKRSWSGRDVDMMVTSIVKRKVLKPGEQKTLNRTYMMGSRKTHFNPMENISCTDPTLWEFSNTQANKVALLGALFNMIRLTTRYVDLINQSNDRNMYHDVAAVATGIFDELNSVDNIDD